MIDTGTEHSFITKQCFESLDQSNCFTIPPKKFYLADGSTPMEIMGSTNLTILFDGIATQISALITKNLSTDLILGMDYLSKYDLAILPSKGIILFNQQNQKIVLPIVPEEAHCDHDDFRFDTDSSNSYPIDEIFHHLNTITNVKTSSSMEQIITSLTKHISHPFQLDSLRNLLLRFQATFDTSTFTIARTEISHAIETHPHTPPVSKSYPGNSTVNAEMKCIVNKLLAEGLVRESQSSYAAPALLVKKKDSTWRLVIDYKRLNAITIKDNYPLPNMEVTLQTLGNKYEYFSKLDLKSGFWQLPIDEKDRHKTAFITPFGLFEWNVLPQGLRNSPPSFQRIMNNVLASCSEFSMVYLDDIVIFSRDYDQHLVHLNEVLNALRLHNLTLTPAKCEIARKSIEYLGHTISATILKPLPEKIKSIILLPEPKSLAQANRFIGSLSWYRKFLPNFATIAAPIHAVTNLSRSNRYKFKWGIEQSKSFMELKKLLTTHPLLLNFPDDKHPVILSTDASKVGLGGILHQDIDNERRILYYHSELLSASQKRYSTIELEALAIFKCINRMKHFLLGRDIIVYTDSCPLCHMMEKTISNKRVQNISLLLQEFNIRQIVHVKGKHNCLPDYLSRHPITNEDELFGFEYGLECSKNETLSPAHQLNAVVTRSKAKQMANNETVFSSTTSSIENPNSSTSSTDSTTSQQFDQHDFDVTKVKDQQKEDPIIQKIISDLKQRSDKSFVYKDGILFKLSSTPQLDVTRKLICVPQSMVKVLLNSYHDHPFIGGHFGVQRTLSKLKQKFWWPNMKQSVTEYIKSCIPCQAFNIDRQKRPGHLHPITIPEGPNQLIGLDYCGPFSISPQGNRYVLCVTDYFTKFVTAIALPNCTASTTASTIFNVYMCRFGVPRSILTDQGTSFNNRLMSALTKFIGYHHIFSTPYHPMSNGQVERFNGTFVSQIAKLIDHDLNNWDDYLQPVVFAYNTGVHGSTQFTPFELTFGQQANLPTDDPPTTFTFNEPNDYFQNLVRQLTYYHRIVKQNVLKQQNRSKCRYDNHRKDPKYDLNSLVLTRNFNRKSKMNPKFSIDPKIVIEERHPTYWVESIDSKIISRVHVNDLKPLSVY